MTGDNKPEAEGSEHSPHRLGTLSTLRSNLFDLSLSSLVLNTLGLALPMTLLQVYDRIIPNKSAGTMVFLFAGVLLALIFESLIGYCRSHVTSWIGAKFEHKAACSGLERLLSTSFHVFEKDGAGIHLERMNALVIVRDFYAGQALLTLLDLPFALLYLGMVAFLAGPLVIVPIVLLTTFGLVATKVGESLRGAISRRMVADDRRFSFLIEVLGGIHSVKALSMEAQMLRRYERLQEACARGNYDVAVENASALSVASFFSQITMVSVAAIGATLVIDGSLTTGGLAACSMLAGRAMTPLQRGLGVWTRFQTFILARKRIDELFALPRETAENLPALPKVGGRLSLEKVQFRFAEGSPLVIRDASLHIEPGECIAISGGSGKTTLLNLMQGALRPTGGRVLVDGYDISQFDTASVRSQLAYLPQTGVLFQGTIMQNLTMFRPELEQVAFETAGLLGLDEVVATMALGFDTPVGDGAYDSLPRGIKQRITIARALVNDPKIILFDEANTAIDTTGDTYLRVCLERSKGRRTMVLVTHRPSLVKLADRVFELDHGVLRPKAGGPQIAPPPSSPLGALA